MTRERKGSFTITRLTHGGAEHLTYHLILNVSYTPIEDGPYVLEDIAREHVEIEMIADEDGVEIPQGDPRTFKADDLEITDDEMMEFLERKSL